ncbi:MAG: hypothetical protein JWN72_2382 [Thermoleophilia bacterium]|nr:hypothetical protein [Thermoleophilia bacterium]
MPTLAPLPTARPSAPARVTTTTVEAAPGGHTQVDNASRYSSASPADVRQMAGQVEAMLGKQLLTVDFEDATKPIGSADRTARVGVATLAPAADLAVFDKLDDAVAVGQQAAKFMAGGVGDPADHLAPGQVIVKVGERYVPLFASMADSPSVVHPLVAQVEDAAAASGWKSISATGFTANDPSVAAVIDGLGQLLQKVA